MKCLPATLIAVTSLILCPIASAQAQALEVNGIAAKVNGRVITTNEVNFMLAPIKAQLTAQYPRRGQEYQTQLKEAHDKILQELIDRQIILDEFKKIGAKMDDHFIDEEIKRQLNHLYNGNKERFNEELRKSRLTMDGYRKMTREKMIVQAMRAEQFSDAPPPLPNEIQSEYNSIKDELRDITQDVITYQVISIPSADPNNPAAGPDTQLALADQLVADLKAGKDFAELAKIHSKDGFAGDGGLRENIPRNEIVAEFAAILFDSKEGTIVGPLVDKAEFKIVKPIKITLGPVPPLSKIRDIVEERVRKKKTSAQYERWIEVRRKRAMISIRK